FWRWIKTKELTKDFPSISGLLNGQGLPDARSSSDKVMQKLNGFIDLFGEGEASIPREHLVRFTSINGGKSVPDAVRVKTFWEEWVQKKELTKHFPSISNLLCQQGLPDAGNPSDKAMQKLNRFIDLFDDGENSIPEEHLVHLTSICSRKGVPDTARVWTFWQWIQEKKLTDIFPSISSLLCGCGLPDPQDSSNKVMQKLNRFIDLFGEGEKQIPVQYLSHFTSMNSKKGVPDIAAVRAFWQWLQDQKLVEIFGSISGMLSGQGLPNPNDPEDKVGQKLENFLALFGEGERQIPHQYLSHFTSMNRSKGVPDAAVVQAFWQWLQGQKLVQTLVSISGMLGGQGVPDPNDLEGKVGQKLDNFLALFGKGERQIPRQYLIHFTSINSSKGVPDTA
ncbi:MAG: hypothetical protein MI749_21525, partial [Desulfovibrionales bacterium]|nr:hypothetical protein [Desulfovibrionales bacterium]